MLAAGLPCCHSLAAATLLRSPALHPTPPALEYCCSLVCEQLVAGGGEGNITPPLPPWFITPCTAGSVVGADVLGAATSLTNCPAGMQHCGHWVQKSGVMCPPYALLIPLWPIPPCPCQHPQCPHRTAGAALRVAAWLPCAHACGSPCQSARGNLFFSLKENICFFLQQMENWDPLLLLLSLFIFTLFKKKGLGGGGEAKLCCAFLVFPLP